MNLDNINTLFLLQTEDNPGNVTLVAAKPLRSSLTKGLPPEVPEPVVVLRKEVVKSDPLSVSVWVPRSPRVASSSTSKVKLGWSEDSTAIKGVHDKTCKMSKRVILNVGGDRHEILSESLARYPHTRLGRLQDCTSVEEILTLCDDYSPESTEYFFDRPPKSFPVVLNLYRKDKLHLAEDICVVDFSEDLQYWEIDEAYLDSCCQMKFQQKKEQISEDMKKDAEFLMFHKEDDFGKGFWAEYRQYIWDLFEKSVTVPQKVG